MKKVTKFEWWSNDADEILEEDFDSLQREAMDHITKMIMDGYYCGELQSEFEDDKGCRSYSGWWNIHNLDKDEVINNETK